ncbi:MAG: aminotransferase class V-fold PLP-dependent enzyme, partial [Shewanella sp.]
MTLSAPTTPCEPIATAPSCSPSAEQSANAANPANAANAANPANGAKSLHTFAPAPSAQGVGKAALSDDEAPNGAIRAQFPILQQMLEDYPLCYLDTAATSQKPTSVLEVMANYYAKDNANVHRAAHQLSARSTLQYEAVHTQVQQFLKAKRREE